MKSFKDFMKHPNCGTPDCCQQCKKEDVNEAKYVKTSPGHLQKTADKIGANWDNEKQAYFKNGLQIGHTILKSKPGEARSYDHFIHSKLKEEAELEEMFYTKKIYQAKGEPPQWAIIPKGQVKPVKVVNSEEEANYRARMMSVKKSKDE